MQAALPHHILWTAVATTGVILSAGYMLWTVQRVFYGELGLKSDTHVHDLSPREHLALWPLVALFLLLGVASPLFMRSIDTAGARIAGTLPQPQTPVRGAETTAATPRTPFVDPALGAAALGKPAPATNPNARY